MPQRPQILSTRRAIVDSALALVAACVAIGLFLPPFASATTASLWRAGLTGLSVLVALALHWVLLGVAARRLGLAVGRWVGLSVLLFPAGGAAALALAFALLGRRLDATGRHGLPALNRPR